MINTRIKQIREILQLNQSDFATKTGVSRSAISEFENGTREPSKSFLLALTDLGISLDWFLTGKGIPFMTLSHVITAQEATNQALEAIAKKNAAILEKEEKSALENELTNTPHPVQHLPLTQPATTPIKESVLGGIEALAREAVAPALTAIEEKIADTASTLAAHTTQSETILAAHAQQLNEISAALRKLQELSGQPLEDTAHERTPLYTAVPTISVVKEPEPSYTALTEDDEDEETPTTRVPLIENLVAGVPREMVDTYETYPVPTSYLKAHKTYFVAKIHGTSMTEAGIADGCHVLLEAKDTPESGDIVIARYENQTTLKRLKQRDDGRWELLYEDGSRAKIELIDPDWAIQAKFIRVV